ncbi:TAXI family TRAP transporter solute-binding subunit [Modicisalibacter radicis]|uniref:TAXI family TRAP transporter solute-binding subunit n=1 Tax=Halomonas sp. EAR18 TaxID=2518972 RepID=UPI00109D5C86|nr:TAXI family TRAP transporter solute-binding subunit [Halomonas sp. EAR18]
MKVWKSIAALTAGLILASGTASADERLSIGTGGTGGLFYVIGAGMADTLNKHMQDTTARAEVTGASIENVRRVAAGQMALGLSSSSTLYEAAHGEGPFDGDPQAVQGIAYLYPAVLQLATTADTDIAGIAELAGKRVSLGPPGSNSAVLAKRILEAYGVFDSIEPQFLSYTEGVGALMDEQIDATAVLAGAPTAALIDLSSQRDMRLLPVEAAQVQAMLDKYPYYQLYDIPAGTYADQDEPVTAINDPAILFTAEDVAEDTIHGVTRTLFSHLDELGEVHPQARKISLDTAEDTPVDLHPGAKRYFEEAQQ